MKKIFALFALGLLLVSNSYAQNSNANISARPFPFNGNDEITITFEILDGRLKGYTGDLWLWAWAPGIGDAPSNENPAANRAAAAKLTRVAQDKYEIKMIPAQFYGISALRLASSGNLGMLVKGRDWADGQTVDLSLAISPPAFESPVVRAFPKAFTAEDIVTIFYDPKLDTEENGSSRAIAQPYLNITLEGVDANGAALFPENYEVPVDEKVKFVAEPNGTFSITFVPNRLFKIAKGEKITKIFIAAQSLDGSKFTPAPPTPPLEVKVY
jgi:hypothetical protein